MMHSQKPVWALLFLAGLFSASMALGQDHSLPTVGDWIRVRQTAAFPHTMTGKIAEISSLGLTLQRESRFNAQIPVSLMWRDVTRLEVRAGAQKSFTGVGVASGLVLGALLSASATGGGSRQCSFAGPCFDNLGSGRAVLAGTVLGALAGGLIGSHIKRDRWRELPLTIRYQYR